MFHKTLSYLALSCALALSPTAFAQPQSNDIEAFYQGIQQLTPQQKILLLNDMIADVNAQYAQRPSNGTIKSYDVHHNLPNGHELIYTYHLQPTLRQTPNWRERIAAKMQTSYVGNKTLCFSEAMVASMNTLGVKQVSVVAKIENETIFEHTQDLPICR